MKKRKNAFTLIELIFTIIIVSILSVVSIPKLMSVRDDSYIATKIEYIGSIVQEISTYTVSQNKTESDLSKMSPLLKRLEEQGEATIDINNKSSTIKVGEENNCLTIKLHSNATEETIETSFINSSDHLCNITQQFIKDKKYSIVLRGQLIKY